MPCSPITPLSALVSWADPGNLESLWQSRHPFPQPPLGQPVRQSQRGPSLPRPSQTCYQPTRIRQPPSSRGGRTARLDVRPVRHPRGRHPPWTAIEETAAAAQRARKEGRRFSPIDQGVSPPLTAGRMGARQRGQTGPIEPLATFCAMGDTGFFASTSVFGTRFVGWPIRVSNSCPNF